ncbi:XRE family transcriptional regulator [Rhodococcus sp. ACPA4]|uniref:Helix-turn-helix protein n=1 Tax=Nocardia globerula TaxID=1818 RepID=A0A652YUA9_NOCGL|nr:MULTISPECIES: helix-turn-helix transcriptional regulator [Rhodococcus]NMD60980.1 helix-turn-helix transcriptional regulator [Nocardia globerula]PBC37557.1 XRE family transcriptional regulator [Rhodococcus sp. ACPA4]PVX67470.1 helix-turn-helix protein [Rhodococcus globerulus]ROZ44168.1 XRE family transcriptional regulator [Rhodococcus sp. WS3]RZL27428.1 MAG: XRE family transcriptional regulator [Rhodococcus sp. (in: high G+C Gram-positive bacteria)]
MAQRFSQRLNALFESAPNHVTNAMVVRSMTEDGCRISTPYLSQLRTGVRTNPSPEVVSALARFFEVTPDYFFNPDQEVPFLASGDSDHILLAQLHNDRLRNLTSRVVDLSPASQALLVEMAENLRSSENLPRVPPDSNSYSWRA